MYSISWCLLGCWVLVGLYSWVAALILVTWYFTTTFRILILLLILKILDGVVGGGGGSSWVAAVILVTERESSLLCPQPSPARGRPQATYVPTCRQFNKKTFGRSEGSSICALVCAAVRDRMCFKGLGRSDGGKGGWPYYDLPNSIGTSLQNIWLWKPPGGDLKSEQRLL